MKVYPSGGSMDKKTLVIPAVLYKRRSELLSIARFADKSSETHPMGSLAKGTFFAFPL